MLQLMNKFLYTFILLRYDIVMFYHKIHIGCFCFYFCFFDFEIAFENQWLRCLLLNRYVQNKYDD